MGDGLLSLNWNNHGATFCHTLAALRGKDKYTDVTVSCEGNFYQVHKLVLSTCSEYFEKIFENTPCKHPVIVLRDVQCDELESLLNYMYKGVVSVAQSDLSRLIKVAELLQIKGLAVPDEPPNPSKSGSHKRSNDDRISPRSSTDSPYPKRRRRRESDNYQPGTSSSSHSKNSESHEPSWSEDRDNRLLDDRLQEPLHSPVTVNVDETLVKEEILDNDSEDQVPETDYGGLGDHSGDASQDAGGLMIPKFDDAKDDEAEPSPVTLPDPVVEALAGPSGLQGWADGGDIARRMALGEGFGSGESQDMSSSVGLPPQASGQPQQMKTRMDITTDAGQHQTLRSDPNSTEHKCPHCSFTSTVPFEVSAHIRIHTGERFYLCLFCPKKNILKGDLVKHMRVHTGEKPFSCRFCSSQFTQGSHLKVHERKHTGEKPFSCSFCSYQTAWKSDLTRHVWRCHQRQK
ncbi:zinc finger and BTB domain-containing protein 14-like isoform X6 [Macrobrachium rosenbergii]|uniref:zinc finger and BTB domain-containing protein 14-like isoform X6 n=1 Tax=Macrobrachium rosenbergii TaxID=79674 RepID=UPI0034D448B2